MEIEKTVREKRSFTPEERAQIVQKFDELRTQGYSVREACKTLGINDVTIYTWKGRRHQRRTNPKRTRLKTEITPKKPHFISIPLTPTVDDGKKKMIKSLVESIETSVSMLKQFLE